MKHFLFGIFFILTGGLYVQGQNHAIDSLRYVLKTEKADTGRVNTLNTLSEKLWKTGKYDTSMSCAMSAQSLAQKLNFKQGTADALRNIGVIYHYHDNYPKALEYDQQALDICTETGNKVGMARNLGNIGVVYWAEGNYPKALEYYFKALTEDTQAGNKDGIASDEGGIGNIYSQQGNFTTSVPYLMKALAAYRGMGDKGGVAINLSNLGVVYSLEGNDSMSLVYDLQALALNREIGDKRSEAIDLGNIGVIYSNKADNAQAARNAKAADSLYNKALQYNRESLAICRQIGDKSGMASALGSIGEIYLSRKEFAPAKIYFDSTLVISKSVGNKDIMEVTYTDLSELDEAMGNYKAGLQDYRQSIIYRDSLVNEANTKKSVQAEMNYEFGQKQAAEKAEQEKKDAIAAQERKRQEIIRNAFIAGFILMLALAFFIFRSYRQKRGANIIITRQKEEVERQKALVEEKNKDITDSINYAKRIQNAILKEEEHVSEHLPEHFILFKPKDIVSGDFYWAIEKEGYFYLAAVDCTGHGVPGGFMSMLGVAFLNEITAGPEVLTPAEILNRLRGKILKELRQTGAENESKDGMDISLMRMNLKTKEVQWSGANNPLYFITGNPAVLQEILPDKQPIGYYPSMNPFTNHTVTIEKDGLLYLFTDGYADQFGGAKGKKFKYKQLQDVLLANAGKPLHEQKKTLNSIFESWKGSLSQVDDLLVIGIRV